MDCQSCGACCFSQSTAYVPLSARDQRRLRDTGLIHEEGGHHYMMMQNGHCAALRIGARFSCSIYEQRPDVCRELERGTPACVEERSLKKAIASHQAHIMQSDSTEAARERNVQQRKISLISGKK